MPAFDPRSTLNRPMRELFSSASSFSVIPPFTKEVPDLVERRRERRVAALGLDGQADERTAPRRASREKLEWMP